MAITVSDISALVARFGNKRINEQVNQAAPIATKILSRLNQPGKVGIVNLKGGGLISAGWLADQGALPGRGAAVDLAQATYLPKFLFSRISIPRGAATLADGKADGVNVVLEQIDSCGAQLGRLLGLACFTSGRITLSAAQATELGADPTPGDVDSMTVSDASMFRVGDAWELRDSSNSYALVEIMQVRRVEIDEDGTSHTVYFLRDQDSSLTSVTAATGDILAPRGSYSNGMVSLTDINAAADLYSTSYQVKDFSGNLKSVTGDLDVQDLKDLWTKATQRRGMPPDCLVSNSRNIQLYMDTLVDQRRFHTGKMDATGGVEADFNGRPFKRDENCPSTSIFGLPGGSDVKLHVFKDFSDDADGGLKAPSASGHVLVSSDYFEYDVQRWGAFNMRCERRNGGFHLSGIGT